MVIWFQVIISGQVLFKHFNNILFGFVLFYPISTIVAYLMPDLYTYMLHIYDLVWFGFIAYQLLLVIQC